MKFMTITSTSGVAPSQKGYLIAVCFVAGMLILSGCDSVVGSHELIGSWELSESSIEPGTVWPDSITISSDELGFPARLTFFRNGQISGRTCNSYTGRYTILAEEQLAVRDWLGTRALCHGGSPDDAVDRAFGGLATYSPGDFEIVREKLIIVYEGVRLEFERAQ